MPPGPTTCKQGSIGTRTVDSGIAARKEVVRSADSARTGSIAQLPSIPGNHSEMLNRNQVKRLPGPRRKRQYKRCKKGMPGERIQLDTARVTPEIYHSTAVDDNSNFFVVEIYRRAGAKNSLDFLFDAYSVYLIILSWFF